MVTAWVHRTGELEGRRGFALRITRHEDNGFGLPVCVAVQVSHFEPDRFADAVRTADMETRGNGPLPLRGVRIRPEEGSAYLETW